MDSRDLNMGIVQQLKDITGDTGQFVAGILSDDISREDQTLFALRLMRLAGHIQQRAQSTAGMVVEGGVLHDGDGGRVALPAATEGRIHHPRPAAND
jgi:hypothetical protein